MFMKYWVGVYNTCDEGVMVNSLEPEQMERLVAEHLFASISLKEKTTRPCSNSVEVKSHGPTMIQHCSGW